MEKMIKDKHKQNVSLVFARHETFHPRFGWLKKGFDKAVENPDVFWSEAAPTILGVGKNMVKAIKYWCVAFKVLEEIKEESQGRRIVPTVFGQNLLGDGGWDPYLEDPASLWLLHWHLLKPPCYATAWYYLFNIFNRSTFIADEVKAGLVEYKDNFFLNNHISETSIMKDVACILRMFTNQHDNKAISEESIDSPFTELGLINNYGDSRHYVFNTSPKRNLPPNIVVSACLDYIDTIHESAKTISISRLAYDAGSPGLCFKLSESALINAIESVIMQYEVISLSDTAGSIQMSFEGDPKILSYKLLEDYYRRGRN